jgi:hypothetical protein
LNPCDTAAVHTASGAATTGAAPFAVGVGGGKTNGDVSGVQGPAKSGRFFSDS